MSSGALRFGGDFRWPLENCVNLEQGLALRAVEDENTEADS